MAMSEPSLRFQSTLGKQDVSNRDRLAQSDSLTVPMTYQLAIQHDVETEASQSNYVFNFPTTANYPFEVREYPYTLCTPRRLFLKLSSAHDI
jgi:hypothetical protein